MYCPVEDECSYLNRWFFDCNEDACPDIKNTTHDCNDKSFSKVLDWLRQGSDVCLPMNCMAIVAPNTEEFYGLGTRATTTINGHNDCSSFRTLSNYCGPGNHTHNLIKKGYPPLSLSDQVALIHDIGWSISQSDEEIHTHDMAIINNLNFIENERNEPNANTYAAKKTFELIKLTLKSNQPVELFGGGWLWDEDEESRLMLSQVLEAIINQPRGKNVIPNNGWGSLVKYMFRYQGDNRIYFDLRSKR